jgi:hypothetical protein
MTIQCIPGDQQAAYQPSGNGTKFQLDWSSFAAGGGRFEAGLQASEPACGRSFGAGLPVGNRFASTSFIVPIPCNSVHRSLENLRRAF